jgi:hypothetical protein
MVLTNHSVLSTAVEIDDLFDYLFNATEKPLKKNPHALLVSIYIYIYKFIYVADVG